MGSARKARENAVDQNHVEDASTIACSTSSSVDVAVFRDRCWTLTCDEQKRRLLVLLSYPPNLPGIASTPQGLLRGQAVWKRPGYSRAGRFRPGGVCFRIPRLGV